MANAKLTAPLNQAKDASFLGSGWSFPPSFSNANYQLDITATNSNIKQSIDIILHTPIGARATNPEFGCTLNKFVFSKFDASLEAEIINSIKMSLLNFEPRIKVDSVSLSVEDDKGIVLLITISYKIKMINSRDNHVFPFYLNEASNLRLKQE